MSNINDFGINPGDPTLDQMLVDEAATVLREMDPFPASRHNERSDATARYVRSFFELRGEPTAKIELSKIVLLDPRVVANVAASDLGPAGKARVKDMVTDLVDHARQYLAKRNLRAPQAIPSSLLKDLAEFVECNLSQHVSDSIRGRITVDLTIHPVQATSIR